MRVIIVDDDEQIVKMLEIYFTKKGHEVVGKAYDGNGAINIIESVEFDAVIMDYRLPDMNGCEVARHIRKIKKEAKIVIITAGDDVDTLDFPVVKKPFKSLKELLMYLDS